MYKIFEFGLLQLGTQLRKFFSILFESMSCRRKPEEEYQLCDYEEQENPPDIFL
jgi:hypothetical protein